MLHLHRRHDDLLEELLRETVRYLRELNRRLHLRIRSASITKRGSAPMAENIKIAVGETATLQARYFDGLPDADGNPTGAEITPTVDTLWSSSDPASLETPVSTGVQQATATGLADATGVGITITDPTSGFTFTQLADIGTVASQVPQSASITKL